MSLLAKKLAPLAAAVVLVASAVTPGLRTPAHAAGGTQLLLYTHLTVPEGAALQTLANQWALKTGNSVKVVVVTSGGFQEFATLAHSGKGPDLYVGDPDDEAGTFQVGGLLAPVPAGVVNFADYVPGALAACSFGGKAYTVPFALDTYTLVYNKALISTPPTTIDQLVSDASKFPNTKGKNYGFLFDPTNLYFSYAYIRAAGGYIFKQNGASVDTSNIGLASAGAIKAYTLFRDLVAKDHLIPPDINTTASVPQGLFQHGQLAMWIDGDWDITANKKALGKNFGSAPLPSFDGGTPHPFEGIQVGFVSAFSHNQALAWSLMKYLLPLGPDAFFKSGGRIPALKSALNSPDVQKDPINAAYITSALNGDPLPNIPEMQAVWTPAANNLALIISGKSTPATAASNMVAQIKKGIAQQQG